MKIILKEAEVMKVISYLSLEDIQDRLKNDWGRWAVSKCYEPDEGLELTDKPLEKVK